MKNFVHFLLLALVTSAALLFTACDDKNTSPKAGAIAGQITPANAVTTVTATDAGNKATTATPSASGEYTINNLTPGDYTLSFTPATGFTAPASQSISVAAGATTTASPVTVTSGSGQGTWSVSGTNATATLVQGNLQFGVLSVTLANTVGQSVILVMDGYTGSARSFSLGSFSTSSQAMYSQMVGTSSQQWTTAALSGGGSGTITITSVNATASPKRVSGTFTFVGQPAISSTTGSKTVTGTFTNVPY